MRGSCWSPCEGSDQTTMSSEQRFFRLLHTSQGQHHQILCAQDNGTERMKRTWQGCVMSRRQLMQKRHSPGGNGEGLRFWQCYYSSCLIFSVIIQVGRMCFAPVASFPMHCRGKETMSTKISCIVYVTRSVFIAFTIKSANWTKIVYNKTNYKNLTLFVSYFLAEKNITLTMFRFYSFTSV